MSGVDYAVSLITTEQSGNFTLHKTVPGNLMKLDHSVSFLYGKDSYLFEKNYQQNSE